MYGTIGEVLNWIKGFLLGPKQRVVINGSKSTNQPGLVTTSTMSTTSQKQLMVKLFADDTKLYQEIRTVEDQHSIQSNIDKIITWIYEPESDKMYLRTS